MKKKCLLIFLVFMLTAGAFAADWQEGLSPAKPYTGSPEVNFEETFGYMMTIPTNGQVIAPGKQDLSLLTPRTDVSIGEGTLSVYNKKTGLVEAVEINEENVTVRPMTEDELNAFMWGSGTVFEVHMTCALEPNQAYFVEVSEGSLSAEGLDKGSWPIAGDDKWAFSTETENFVESVEYVRPLEIPEAVEPEEDGEQAPKEKAVKTVQVGDAARITVSLANGCGAAPYCNKGNLALNGAYLEAPGELRIVFAEEGECEWGVAFIDPDGSVLYTQDFTTAVGAVSE